MDDDPSAHAMRDDRCDRLEFGLGRQRAERAVDERGGGGCIDIADDRDFERIARQHAPRIRFEIVDRDARHRFERPVDRHAIGMTRERGGPPVTARQVVRTHAVAAQPRHDLRADALHRFAIETRLGHGQPQVIEGFVAVVLEGLQGAAQIIASGAEVELDRFGLEARVERRRVERTGSLVEQASGKVGDPRLVGGILIGAAENGEVDRDQRQCVIAHEPCLDAARADHALDGHRPAHRRKNAEHQDDDERGQRMCRGAPGKDEGAHERLSSAGISLTRWPVTERRLSSQRCAASRTASAPVSRMRSGQLRTCSTVAPVASAAPYHCAMAR